MDLRLYFRVFWRFRWVVGAGLILGLALAFLSYTRITFTHGKPTISYRESETWEGSATLFVTQSGFPWGRTVFPGAVTDATGAPVLSNFADPNRLAGLATYYTQLANSDAVQALIAKRGPVHGLIQAVAVYDQRTRSGLPFVQIKGIAADRETAVTLANRGVAAFKRYLSQQQQANRIPTSQRVTLATLNRAQEAVLTAGRRKTTPVVIFLTVALAAIGLAFLLENVRPRVRLVESGGADSSVSERRTA